MIDYLRHLAVFSRVVQEGSFAGAARSLGLAPSRVSESVSKLEHYVGFTLINRTTRKISLTSEGRRLHENTSGILEGAERGLDELRVAKSVLMGSLRISVPTYLSATSLAQAIGRFVALNPQVYITAEFTDHPVDPVKDGYDMCIRSGRFDGRTGTSRKLGTFDRAICAGRGYLADRPNPTHPKDIARWDWVNYRHRKRSYDLVSDAGEATKLLIKDEARLQVDNIEALYSFVCMDVGLAVMPLGLVERGIREGKLVRLFDDWRLSRVHYFAVWPDKSHRKSLVSVFAGNLSEYLRGEDP